MKKFRSHPHKALETHIEGVLAKTLKRTDLKIAEIAALFHDLGKINDNFQQKLEPENKGKNLGYSEHAYLSAYAFLCYMSKNATVLGKDLMITERSILFIKTIQILVIVAKHHGHLPDLSSFFKESNENENPLTRLKNYLQTNGNTSLPISTFYHEMLGKKHNPFDLSWNSERIGIIIFNSHKNTWKENALDYFLDTQFAFASLIEADKRDAGDLEEYDFDNKISESISKLRDNLAKKFNGLNNVKINELNELRTCIREEAVKNIVYKLTNTDERVFTLTAPTGAGKTFTLLALASEIQQQKGNLGILYALPFLSITEQVQNIIEQDLEMELLNVNSKAKNERIEQAQQDLDNQPTEENIVKLIKEDFFQQTFDHPFVLTTFVQFFETLMSNRNSTLLKLPNFKNRIFLIDEIQSLPPRLYIFFVGWLQEFCKKNNSYCILSTATMPYFEIPERKEKEYAKSFFKNYQVPKDLLESKKYFDHSIFKRYQINWLNEKKVNQFELVEHILQQKKSCLIIVNTIDDSKKIFEMLESEENIYLLNTHFTPLDRKKKIEIIKKHLKNNEKVTLISTQLIEAGVDISFPIVYRDLCPLPSLIQSAGRCNRNNELPTVGQIYFFNLVDDNGKSRADLIYQDNKDFLDFCRNNIKDGLMENELFELQKNFFEKIGKNYTISETQIFDIENKKLETKKLIDLVNDGAFQKLGFFRLLQKEYFGEEYQYYIPDSDNDQSPKIIKDLINGIEDIKSRRGTYQEYKTTQSKLETHLKKMSEQIINIRIPTKYNQSKEAPHYSDEFLGIRVLSDLNDYSFEKGIVLKRESFL